MSAAHRTIRGPDPRRASLALAALASVGVVALTSALFDVLSFPHVPYLLLFVAAMIVVLREHTPAPQPAKRTAAEPATPPSGNGAPGLRPPEDDGDDSQFLGRREREPVPVG